MRGNTALDIDRHQGVHTFVNFTEAGNSRRAEKCAWPQAELLRTPRNITETTLLDRILLGRMALS
jgi:hypothetical protein